MSSDADWLYMACRTIETNFICNTPYANAQGTSRAGRLSCAQQYKFFCINMKIEVVLHVTKQFCFLYNVFTQEQRKLFPFAKKERLTFPPPPLQSGVETLPENIQVARRTLDKEEKQELGYRAVSKVLKELNRQEE